MARATLLFALLVSACGNAGDSGQPKLMETHPAFFEGNISGSPLNTGVEDVKDPVPCANVPWSIDGEYANIDGYYACLAQVDYNDCMARCQTTEACATCRNPNTGD